MKRKARRRLSRHLNEKGVWHENEAEDQALSDRGTGTGNGRWAHIVPGTAG